MSIFLDGISESTPLLLVRRRPGLSLIAASTSSHAQDDNVHPLLCTEWCAASAAYRVPQSIVLSTRGFRTVEFCLSFLPASTTSRLHR